MNYSSEERPENCTGYPRVANRDASDYVENKKGFRGSNLYGLPIYCFSSLHGRGHLYVVYSYGPHFPLAVFDHVANKWYHNEDRYSRTTSKHYGNAGVRSLGEGADTEFLRKIIDCGGVVNAVAARLEAA